MIWDPRKGALEYKEYGDCVWGNESTKDSEPIPCIQARKSWNLAEIKSFRIELGNLMLSGDKGLKKAGKGISGLGMVVVGLGRIFLELSFFLNLYFTLFVCFLLDFNVF